MTNREAILGAVRALPGPKTRLWGFRWHHGLLGCQLAALSLVWPRSLRIARHHLLLVGLLLAAHDWPDRSDWFRGRWT